MTLNALSTLAQTPNTLSETEQRLERKHVDEVGRVSAAASLHSAL